MIEENRPNYDSMHLFTNPRYIISFNIAAAYISFALNESSQPHSVLLLQPPSYGEILTSHRHFQERP